jgi:tetratricopeptide (TPR) repeat protein
VKSAADLLPHDGAASLPSVKTVYYRRRGIEGATGRVSVRTLREMISRWELAPDDYIRIDGDAVERRIREYPALSPLDEMLHHAAEQVTVLRKGGGRRSDVIRELEMLREYADLSDRVHSVASFLLGWLRYAENPALARGLFLKAIERGYPYTSMARNNLAVAQIRLGDPAGRDNLILAANDPQRTPVALLNLARLLQHLQTLGESTDEIANIKDLTRVARAEWRKATLAPGDPANFALFICDGDIPESFASESRALGRAQGQIEDILAEGEDCLRQGRLEQATGHAARAAAEMERAQEDLARNDSRKGSPLKFLSVRLGRLERDAASARDARERYGQLEAFRRRLGGIEGSLQLKVPPADLIQQAEILLDAARSEGERGEARKILRECQSRVAAHLMDTANKLLATGERDVAVGLLRKALAMDSDLRDEVRLRLASVRRSDLEKEIAQSMESGHFEEARARIARLRSIHPIYEPLAKRLEHEADIGESNFLLDAVVSLCASRPMTAATVARVRELVARARVLNPDPTLLGPMEEHITAVELKFGVNAARPDVDDPATNKDSVPPPAEAPTKRGDWRSR